MSAVLSGRAAADAALRRLFVAEAQRSAGLIVSNRGGWHSLPDLAQRADPDLRALMAVIAFSMRDASRAMGEPTGAARAEGVALTAWATVMRPGDEVVAHDHADATWSAVYYVDPGDADRVEHPDSGRLLFPDVGLSIVPEAGMLVLFPGRLVHRVAPYQGPSPRVAIAANGSLR